jgi:uncharacterized spore protein YtfJ
MYIVWLVVFLTASAAVLLFVRPLRTYFLVDSDKMSVRVSAGRLIPVSAAADLTDLKAGIAVFVFNRKVFALRPGGKKRGGTKRLLRLAGALDVQNVSVKAEYGTGDPFATAMAVAALAALGRSGRIDGIEQHPDFLSSDGRFVVSGTARINAGKTLLNLAQIKGERNNGELENMTMAENVDTLFHSLENFTQKEGIIGKPVTQGDKTFLPVVSITVGYGEGSAAGKNQANQQANGQSTNTGAGALGLGAKLSTDAVIVIDGANNQDVKLLSLTSSAGTMMDKIPQVISSINQSKQSKGQPQQSAGMTAGM